jgi:hypothetical protein
MHYRLLIDIKNTYSNATKAIPPSMIMNNAKSNLISKMMPGLGHHKRMQKQSSINIHLSNFNQQLASY